MNLRHVIAGAVLLLAGGLSGAASAQDYSRTDTVVYHDDLAHWVLGQFASSTNNDTGLVEAQTVYDSVTALPIRTYSFGKLQQTLTYHAADGSDQAGTLATVKDGNNNVTTLSGWKRGLPQTIHYPATPEAPAGAVQSALVDVEGHIASVTDENGDKTCYAYDAMGRVKQVTYPSETANVCDTSAWVVTSMAFVQTAATDADYGIPGGHWKQTVTTGKGTSITYFDALFRPLVAERFDNTSATTANATRSIVVKRYDASGRLAFESYPLRTLSSYATATAGTTTKYDAIGRVTEVSVPSTDSATGVFKTTTAYLPGFQTRVTNPRGYAAQTRYLVYDDPSTAIPSVITNPEGAYTYIGRDVFGKPTYVVRRNGPGDVFSRRRYVYDANQQLCKTFDPEAAATVRSYDAAGNLAWSASGMPFASAADCNTDDVAVSSRTTRTYDARNRIASLTFPDHRGDTTFEYTPDNLTASLVADNSGSLVRTTYTYNRRRLMIDDRMTWNAINMGLTYLYDANGHLASQIYFGGTRIDYAPNALGQATQAGPYASLVSYYPNGAIAQFRYGNGIVHTMTQNDRQLPERSRDAYLDTVVALDDSYDYDANGNVAAISDALPGSRGNRTMTYDGLDRLTKAVSPMFGPNTTPTSAYYFYDVLDNLTRVKMLAANNPRDQYYCYDANWRLTNVKTTSCSGATVIGLGYDAQGNLSNKNGVLYDFDFGNRLRSVSDSTGAVATYVYDALGRRVRDVTSASKYSLYSHDGQLAFANDLRTGTHTTNIYLGGSLIAELELAVDTGITYTRYMHTDALGSVVARSSAGRSSVVRNEYEPFGALIYRANYDRPTYAGHVGDAATGLDYMQQRYYDPLIGRFLSVDPVAANTDTGGNFNRYWYANNNPYLFKDPDGRASWRMFADAFRVEVSAGVQVEGKIKLTNAVQLSAGLGSISLGGGISGAGDAYKFEEGRDASLSGVVANKVQAGWAPNSWRSEQGRYDVPFTEHKEEGGFAFGLKQEHKGVSAEAKVQPSPTEVSVKLGLILGIELKVDIGQAAYGLFSARPGEKPAQEIEANRQWTEFKQKFHN